MLPPPFLIKNAKTQSKLSPTIIGALKPTKWIKPKQKIIQRPYQLTKVPGPEHLYQIILHPDTHRPTTVYVKTPISKLSKPKTIILKILWKHGLITQEKLIYFYQKWRDENLTILMTYTHPNGRVDMHETPVRRRGNEAYHKYTWSRLQSNIMGFQGYPKIYEETKEKEIKTHWTGQTKNRTIVKCNILFLTLTYPATSTPWKTWSNLSEDMNRFQTNMKSKLKKQGNKILYYIKALESTEKGIPHLHFLIKLKHPIKTYKIYNPSKKRIQHRAFNDTPFKWKHHKDLEGIKNTYNCVPYITKYITKATKPAESLERSKRGSTKFSLKHIKTMALSWASNKRLYSTSIKDYFQEMYPNTHKWIKNHFKQYPENHIFEHTKTKVTDQSLREEFWDNFHWPKLDWESTPQLRKTRWRDRVISDRISEIILSPKLELRSLSYEGSYQVVGIRLRYSPEHSVIYPILSRKGLKDDAKTPKEPPPKG